MKRIALGNVSQAWSSQGASAGVGWIGAATLGLLACATSEIPAPTSQPPVEVAVAQTRPSVSPAPLVVAADDTPEVSYRCAGGSLFLAEDHRPYCVQSQPATFRESDAWCRSNGGRLLTIDGDAHGAALQSTFAPPNPTGDRMWIGLAQLRSGPWQWATGFPVLFASWAVGEPNNSGGAEHCGEFYPASAQWNDLACETAQPFLCEARRRKGALGRLACTGRSFQVGSTTYCYDANRSAPWDQAETTCKGQGGTLATFENAAELAAFHSVTRSPAGADRVWLGIVDEGHEGRWTNPRGRTADYTKWRAGEPNDAGGENCAEWHASDAGWNDIPCDQVRTGVCIPP